MIDMRAEPKKPGMLSRANLSARPFVSLLGPVGMFVAALAIRWPYLWDVPRLTDETREVLRALAIYYGCFAAPGSCQDVISAEILNSGGLLPGWALPFTNFDPYMGALFNYILAFLFSVAGPNPFLPRLLATMASSATTVVVYIWGEHLGGKRLGLLAGLLLALSAGETYATAHIAYSNSLTPFLLTLALYLLQLAIGGRGPAVLIGAGLVSGAAAQTHASAIPVLAAAALLFLAIRWAWLRTLWPYAAAIAFLIGASNFILFHLLSGFAYLQQNEGHFLANGLAVPWASYARGVLYETVTLRGMLSGSMALAYEQWQGIAPALDLRGSLAGTIPPTGGVEAGFRLISELVFPLAALAGLVLAARRRVWLLPIATAAWLFGFPLYHTQREFLTRYNVVLLPVLFLCVAMAVLSLWDRLSRHSGRVPQLGMLALAVILLAGNLVHAYGAAAEKGRREPTNWHLYQVAQVAAAYAEPEEIILVDRGMHQDRPRDESVESRSMDYYLSFLRLPKDWDEAVTRARVNRALASRPSQLAIAEPARIEALREHFDVQVVPESEVLLHAAGGGNTIPVVARLWPRPVHLPPDAVQTSATLDGRIQLIGYRLSANHLSAGQPLRVTLYWRPLAPMAKDYTIFLHLINAENAKAAQRDTRSEFGPTTVWPAGSIIADEYELKLKEGARPGPARLLVGMYEWPSLQRLATEAEEPVKTEGDALVLPVAIDIRLVPPAPAR